MRGTGDSAPSTQAGFGERTQTTQRPALRGGLGTGTGDSAPSTWGRARRTQHPAPSLTHTLGEGLVTGRQDSAPSTQGRFGDSQRRLSAQHPPCAEDSALSTHALQTPGFFIKSPGLGRCPTPHRHRQTDTRGKGIRSPGPCPACLPWPKASLRP